MTPLIVEIFVLCDLATVSQEQKLSIIGIFDQFFVANIPTSWSRMFLVAVVKGEAGKEYPLTLRLVPPGPTEQKFPDREIRVTLGPNGKANLMTELVNFPLPLAGLYKVELLNDSQKVGDLTFIVNKTTATYGGTDLKGKKISN